MKTIGLQKCSPFFMSNEHSFVLGLQLLWHHPINKLRYRSGVEQVYQRQANLALLLQQLGGFDDRTVLNGGGDDVRAPQVVHRAAQGDVVGFGTAGHEVDFCRQAVERACDGTA